MNHLEMGNLSIAILSNQRVFVAKCPFLCLFQAADSPIRAARAAQGVLDPDGPPWNHRSRLSWTIGTWCPKARTRILAGSSVRFRVSFSIWFWTQGMDGLLGVAGIIINMYYGSFPYSRSEAPVSFGGSSTEEASFSRWGDILPADHS